MLRPADTLLTTAQAALLMGVHPRTVARWIDRGMLWAITTPGGHRRVPLPEVEKFWRALGPGRRPGQDARKERGRRDRERL